jgi:protein-disulfide isomerase
LEAQASALAAQPAAPTTPVAATSASDPFAQWWSQQARIDLGIPADGAKVVIVKFNDFFCAGCAQAHFLYKPVLDRFAKSHPGAVRLVVKDWPWDVSCNFNAGSTIPGHEAACAAAGAARMAADRGKYDEMAQWLYQNRGRSVQEVRAAAAKLLSVTDFEREFALKLPAIRRDIADGGALGVRSTPTYFINGVRINELLQPAQFERAIGLELQR